MSRGSRPPEPDDRGRGIAHAEQTPRENSGTLNGVQLWIALPDAVRSMPPAFQCTSDLGALERPSGVVTVFAGDMAGQRSNGNFFSPILGAEIKLHTNAALDLPLDPAFEHGLMLVEGEAHAEGTRLDIDTLYYVTHGADELRLKSELGAKVLLIGGAPSRYTGARLEAPGLPGHLIAPSLRVDGVA